MKYHKLHKFNAKQEEGSLCWSENHHECRSRGEKNTNDRDASADNSQKIKSLMKAMHRVLSGGEQQRQPPGIPDPDHGTRNSGFNQLEEVFNKFTNGGRERVSANAQ